MIQSPDPKRVVENLCLECINLKIAVSLYLSSEKEYLVKTFLSS